MPRIPPDDSVQVTVVGGASGANMTALFGVMAHRPAIMQHAQQLLEATMREGTVEATLKELLAVRVSQVNDCFY
jgi:alkylhydroperoxidase family enzyme